MLVSASRRLSTHLAVCRNYHQAPGPKEFKVILDGETLYIHQELAQVLGWTKETPTKGVSLQLSGWSPHYFAITHKGTDTGKSPCASETQHLGLQVLSPGGRSS
ncbi:hypothetical protein FA15DRAFT_603793 [Coprinopsis marcescibilis]|uniref:Uncharacterized protein n=1 Tax=Coprinopsis marcescibilis TaxID=230819 RepID=A0A5C3KDW9_COPMA|nr:hypothetical protein FA15DRAFT_603793 [Coprinopsis marcescibilis]